MHELDLLLTMCKFSKHLLQHWFWPMWKVLNRRLHLVQWPEYLCAMFLNHRSWWIGQVYKMWDVYGFYHQWCLLYNVMAVRSDLNSLSWNISHHSFSYLEVKEEFQREKGNGEAIQDRGSTYEWIRSSTREQRWAIDKKLIVQERNLLYSHNERPPTFYYHQNCKLLQQRMPSFDLCLQYS